MELITFTPSTQRHGSYVEINLGFFLFFRFFIVFHSFSQFFSVFSVCFEKVCFSCFVSIPKQTEDPPKQFKRQYIWVFLRKLRVVSVYFGLLRNSFVCFGCFDIGSKHRNKPKFFGFGFTKQTETNPKQILFRFVSVRTEIYFCLFRGHPNWKHLLVGAEVIIAPTIPC